MNYSCFIIKILSNPIQSYFEDNISLVEILGKFPQIRNKRTIEYFRISIWGNLADDVIKYYQINDYLIIEGYISVNQNLFEMDNFAKNNQVEISVRKIYPFLLNNRMKYNNL
jgi:single-stranded DNA-binding protein